MRLASAVFLFGIIFFAIIFALPKPEGFPILEYHTITKNPMKGSEVYNVPPEEFAAQLDYLKQKGYTTVTLREFMQAKHGKITLPENPIVLTFDDGYENIYTEMLPILEAKGMKAVVYVITNELDKPGYLTLEQVKDMQKRGIEIGSHTADHLALVNESAEMQLHQVSDSRIFLHWSGLEPIYTFSYPNGAYNSDIIKILKQEKYLSAVTGDVGLNTLKSDPYTLKRVHIRNPHFGITEFKWRLMKAELAEKILGSRD